MDRANSIISQLITTVNAQSSQINQLLHFQQTQVRCKQMQKNRIHCCLYPQNRMHVCESAAASLLATGAARPSPPPTFSTPLDRCASNAVNKSALSLPSSSGLQVVPHGRDVQPH